MPFFFPTPFSFRLFLYFSLCPCFSTFLHPFPLHCCSFFHILRTTYCLEHIVLAGDVELNPGPTGKLIIGSYNVRGCNSYQKTKRLGAWILKLKSCHRLVFSLQETHISAKNFSTARMLWREGLVLSPSLNNTRGVLTFYSTL